MKLEIPLSRGLSLFPFQKTAVRQMREFLDDPKTRGCYNACEMGLGKTVQTIALLNTYPNSRILVVCPSIMRLEWREEFKKWGTFCDFSVPRIAMIESSDELVPHNREITIVSYDLLNTKENISYFTRYPWGFLIIDEAHKVKNPETKRGEAVLKHLWPISTYKIALSGTPFTNNVIDGFSLFNKFAPDWFDDFYRFADRYTNRKYGAFSDRYEGIKNEEELKILIRSRFFIRYRKEEVLPELPPKTFKEILLGKEFLLQLTQEEKEAMVRYHKRLRKAIKEKRAVMPQPPVSVAKKRREQGILKIPAIVELCKEYLAAHVPIVLFLYHTEVIKRIANELKKFKPAVIQGSTSQKCRTEAKQAFKTGATDLFIGQVQAAGIGINLTRSSNVIIGEHTYNPTDLTQSVDRVHRIGQKRGVLVEYFLVENSVEEKVIKILMRKVRDFSKLLN